MYATRYGSKITPADYTVAVNKTLMESESSKGEESDDSAPAALEDPAASKPTSGRSLPKESREGQVVDRSNAEATNG